MTKAFPRLMLGIAAFALGACGGGQSEAEAPPSPTPAETAAPSPAPSPAAAVIPARFLGVWDAETGSCDPASDLRLEIAPSEIGFYESHGTLNRIAESPDGAAMVDLAMEGEGEEWDMSMTLNLTGSDKTERLVVRHQGEPGEPAPEPLRLKRCPA